MPYSICKDFAFAAAHRIPDHPGKCQYLHGHNYRVRVYLSASELDELGMVVDFAQLKQMMKEVAGPFDHRVINDFPPFDEKNPTAESVAEYIYRGIEERLDQGDRVRLDRVEVWENDASCAAFEP